jgi:hypothetical protein
MTQSWRPTASVSTGVFLPLVGLADAPPVETDRLDTDMVGVVSAEMVAEKSVDPRPHVPS